MLHLFRDGNGNLSSQRLMTMILVLVAAIFAFLHPGIYQGYLAIFTIALGSKGLQKIIEKLDISINATPHGFFSDSYGTLSIMRVCCFIVIIVASAFALVFPNMIPGYTGMMSLAMGGKIIQKKTEKKK